MHHAKQAHPWGCIYHALYAVTGEASLLDHVADISEPRARARLHALGYALMPLPVTPQFSWAGLVAAIPEGAGQGAVITIDGQVPGTLHAVALELRRGGITVSDSALADPQDFTLEAFGASRYAAPYLTELLISLDLDAYPVQDAREALAAAKSAEASRIRETYAM